MSTKWAYTLFFFGGEGGGGGFTGIIQKKSASDSRALPILVFDEKKKLSKK